MEPDLVGFKLNRAIEILNSKGYHEIKVTVTAAPREEKKEPDGEMRVIKFEINDANNVILLVCR